MKARVIETGEFVEIIKIEDNLFIDSHYYQYEPSDIEWEINDNDYWTRLEHQYAGMAMQGLLQSPHLNIMQEEPLVGMASSIAHALVEKMKEER